MDEEDDGLHVRAPTLEDLARLCRSLNETAARYILIGGFAVIALTSLIEEEKAR